MEGKEANPNIYVYSTWFLIYDLFNGYFVNWTEPLIAAQF